MSDELRQAIQRAVQKVVIGWGLVFVLVGARFGLADRGDLESQIAALPASAESLPLADGFEAPRTAPSDAGSSGPEDAADTSIVSRFAAAVGDRGGNGGRDADRLVSCRLGGRTQFMRGADCATRGGRSTDFVPDSDD